MKKHTLIIAIVILTVWIAHSAQAHRLWLNASHHSPKPGETIWIEIGWGHKYPRDQVIRDGLLERIYALGPDGQEAAVEMIFPSFYKFTPKIKGTYQIIAKAKPGFLSITTDGHKLGSKKEVANVSSCFQFLMNAKTLIQVGGEKNGYERGSKQPLEILPMKDPGSLKVGDILPVKIMFQGKSLAGTELRSSHDTCSGDKKQPWVLEQQSDSQGLVHIKLSDKGPWTFNVSHKTPYPDTSECDSYSYRTSLTVGF